jgi:hypothetical protein
MGKSALGHVPKTGLEHVPFRKHLIENSLGNPFYGQGGNCYILIKDCLPRRKNSKTSAYTESWGTCLQITFWDTPTHTLKASYIWTGSHACNYNRMHYG